MYSSGLPTWVTVFLAVVAICSSIAFFVVQKELREVQQQLQRLQEEVLQAAQTTSRRLPLSGHQTPRLPLNSERIKSWNTWSNWLLLILLAGIFAYSIALIVMLVRH